ncbi:putative reverse transcriptase zinc-binding domain-containing protein [Helianthus annuus]|nr:putative reverse transcriptase zinc-binding domain-containing protein [Helianthus annuus]
MSVDNSKRYVYNWCKWIPQKCNIFAWRSELNRIPTGMALRNRNIPIVDVSCPFCNSGDETVDHLFTACVVASTVWQAVTVAKNSWCPGVHPPPPMFRLEVYKFRFFVRKF